ncbi:MULTISPECIES: hypothetical protein [unclassified Streptomyces]|uniref:SCO2400 family protein n=1 Tax=unclassified Streptomyces TaxID=2593676 RepID=UPI0038249B69
MDYCSSCRRHLNGALACPGCGAYTPNTAPRAVVTPWRAPAAGTRYDDTQGDPANASAVSSPAVAAAPAGRAARRRQRARWKKTQRRALVATAVALVGGGLTVASLDRQSTDQAQAASAPDNRAMGVADQEATVPVTPASAATGRHRAPGPSDATRRQAAGNVPHEQTTGTPRATTTPRRLPLVSAPSTASSAATSQAAAATAPASSGTTTAPQSQPAAAPTTAAPTPAADDSTPAPTASTAPAQTRPPQLCLLVICLG